MLCETVTEHQRGADEDCVSRCLRGVWVAIGGCTRADNGIEGLVVMVGLCIGGREKIESIFLWLLYGRYVLFELRLVSTKTQF